MLKKYAIHVTVPSYPVDSMEITAWLENHGMRFMHDYDFHLKPDRALYRDYVFSFHEDLQEMATLFALRWSYRE